MDLSVIIVNFNVCHFLEQAVASSLEAMKNIDGEIIVVDNASIDQSCSMMERLFPQVKLIKNKENLGFAKANNIGIEQAQSEFVLLLNPDTIVQEDCFVKCLSYMRSNAQIGALGVKMLDGAGQILPESKRGFPSLWTSFCKMSGLYKLFPQSRLFNSYYLGHLDYEHNHVIEILTGAFFFTRRKLITQLGGLDESYFMYGEDIDLSYSIRKLGFEIVYFAETQIIHFKGESTKKSNLNYWTTFYQAMLIFAKKHHASGSWLYISFIKLAIFTKGMLSFLKAILKRSAFIIIDGFFILIGAFLIKKVLSIYIYHSPYHFQTKSLWFNLISYTCIWIFCLFLNGIYDQKYKLKDIFISVILGFFFSLSIYALMPETLRSSRILLGFIFIWVLLYVYLSRLFVRYLKHFFTSNGTKSILIVGNKLEEQNIEQILKHNRIEYNISARIDSNDNLSNVQWPDLIKCYKLNEIIFCPSLQSVYKMMSIIPQFTEQISIKMLSSSGSGLIGSSDRTAQGELYTFEFTYNLQKEKYKRQKRFFDISFSLLVLLFSVVLIFLVKNRKQLFLNLFNVLFGFKTWVGVGSHNKNLFPHMIEKSNVLEPLNDIQKESAKELVAEVYKNYLWNYSVWMDLDICLRDINQLDHHFDR